MAVDFAYLSTASRHIVIVAKSLWGSGEQPVGVRLCQAAGAHVADSMVASRTTRDLGKLNRSNPSVKDRREGCAKLRVAKIL